MSDIRKNDYGFAIKSTIRYPDGSVVDISGATTKEYLIRSPSGTVTAKSASFVSDGTDGQLTWTTTASFFNEVGAWTIEAHVTDGSSYNYQTRSAGLSVGGILAV